MRFRWKANPEKHVAIIAFGVIFFSTELGEKIKILNVRKPETFLEAKK